VYDALGRPTGEQPEGGAWLEVDYRMPTTTQPNLSPQVTTSACPNMVTGCSGAQLLSWQRVEYDGLGRVFEESQRIPGSGGLVLEEKRSTWNAMGWPLTQSVWGDFSQVIEWRRHDRFGRPGEVCLPGEMPTRFTYHGDRAVTRDVRIASSQSWNRYSYALNNPVNYTDPEGLIAELFFDLQFVVFDEITVEGA